MEDRASRIHSANLTKLIHINNLKLIHERPSLITNVFPEPRYCRKGGLENLYCCPDLFLKYELGIWSVIELKHNMKSKKHAKKQLDSGIEMLLRDFDAAEELITAKIVTYEKGFAYYTYKQGKI